jgi:hypothetical protein
VRRRRLSSRLWRSKRTRVACWMNLCVKVTTDRILRATFELRCSRWR